MGRKVLAIMIAGLACLWLAIGQMQILAMVGDELDHTIEHSKDIHKLLRQCASDVDAFKVTKNRLPDASELEALCNGSSVELVTHLSKKVEIIDKFGAPPTEGYALSYWRGEWSEYYASWTDATSLTFDKNDYFRFRSPMRDSLVNVILFVLLIIAAFKAWPKSKNRI